MHRRVSLFVLLVLAVSLLPVSVGTASAATFRTRVAQAPSGNPTSAQTVRVWMQSDTALGETAGVEYNVGSSYVKVLGTFDTSGLAPANWRADLPAQPSGTVVRYQLFTRNQSGSDYGFTGFNWSYTVDDGDIQWDAVLHDSLSADYRSPGGPVPAGTSVRLRLRVAQGDITAARVRAWNDRSNVETYYAMSWDGAFDTSSTYDWWTATLPASADPTILYYMFELTDQLDQDFYVDDDVKFLGGGLGAMSDSYDDSRSFQVSVFDPAFFTPEWMQRAVIYQIFPDRFRDGDPSNNPQAGRFSYARAGGAIVRSNSASWNTAVCDPRAAGACFGYYGDNFYGGDLRGITQKLEDGYFTSLGVTLLYLNPIFRAPSNHKYDTANFLEIDPDFGTLADFQAMVAAANARGIRVMLDGVFNHTSSDSPYFDRYGRYAADGTLNDADGGTFDGSGACEAVSAAYRAWFYFPDTGNAGKDGSTTVYCADASGNPTVTYEAWYGYSSLPKIRSGLATVRQYFYGSADANGDGYADAVGPYWTKMGASGWRFDVGADVDPGLTNDPANDYWEGFRATVRNPALSGKSDTVMLGEEWGDASPWLLGGEWDSVMNYRFRSAVLGWMFTGCSGNGCSGGAKFQENDSNDSSSSGSIFYLSPSQFNARLRSIHEDYPDNAFKAMMNLEGSHDTQRVRFLLKKINNDSDGAALQRMKEWWLFAFTYPGAPTLYYGDEVGLSHDGVWDGSQFQDDPYNRAPFPWPDAGGSAYVPDTDNLQAFARHMASVRHSYRALQDGDVQHGLVIDDAQQLYGFARTNGQQTALVLLNRSGQSRGATFGGLNAAPYNLPDGTVLLDAIGGATYTVSGGAVTVNVTSTWGAVLLEQDKIETPAAAAPSATAQGADVALTWPMVAGDSTGGLEVVTSYTVHRGASSGFTPSAANQIASLANPAFGGDPSYTDTGAAAGGYYYIVKACNAAGKCSSSAAVPVTAQAAALSVDPASGTFGGSAALRATLTAGASPLAGRTVTFSLNGASAGSATTDAGGVATLPGVSLSGIGAGSYPSGVSASFAGDGAYSSASGDAALSVARAATTTAVTCSAGPFTYTGVAQTPCAAAVSGPGLSQALAVTYADNVNAGTATASAAYGGDANYEASGGSATFTIARAASATTVSCPASVTYTGSPLTPCTATVTGPGGLSQALAVTYADNTAVGTATASATYAGGANHLGSSGSATFTIVSPPSSYAFAGFFAPVDSPPVINVAKAGSAIPVKFSLGGDFGLDIFAAGYPKVAALACPSNAPTDAIETTVGATANSLSYDAATGRYTYVWKTEKSFAGSCRQLVLKFSDGTTKTATFNFTR